MAENPPRIRGIISDFGGVLTTPLIDAFLAFQEDVGITPKQLGECMAHLAEKDGQHPLFELERGRISEAEFLSALEVGLKAQLGRHIPLHGFRETYFETLSPNEPMIDLMRELKARGYKMALLTNNVREWEPHWRSMLPVDEIFEQVVDSAFVGFRKPEPEIYRLTLDRMGLEAHQCVFIDDVDVNCDTAREMGMHVVEFNENAQAIADIQDILSQEVPQKPTKR